MDINIKIIPHDEQRYPTVGDYWEASNGDLEVRISKMSDARYEQLVIIHELVEYFLCKHRGIKLEDIDEFDINYENQRISDADEPGNHPDAPYFNEHQFATALELRLAEALTVAWATYDDEVNSL